MQVSRNKKHYCDQDDREVHAVKDDVKKSLQERASGRNQNMDKRRNCFIVKSADNSTCQGNVPPTERFGTNVNKGIITQKKIVCQDERKTQGKKVNVDCMIQVQMNYLLGYWKLRRSYRKIGCKE